MSHLKKVNYIVASVLPFKQYKSIFFIPQKKSLNKKKDETSWRISWEKTKIECFM